jgi:hypothetical protein
MNAKHVLAGMGAIIFCLSVACGSFGNEHSAASLRVGWAQTEITPPRPASIVGFHGKRISTGVRDPLKATVLALESVRPDGQSVAQAILVSCDLLWIRQDTQHAVAEAIGDRLENFDLDKLVLNATHTHQGPATESEVYGAWDVSSEERDRGVMTGEQYRAFFAERVAQAVIQAWQQRRSGGTSWALDQAVVGFNRRFVYSDGTAKMLGAVNTPEFDCIEGVEDHGLGLLFFWNEDRELTGIVVNVASPAQSEQGGSLISADFWHDVREEMASRYGADVFVLAQCGAAGDIYPQGMFRHRAELAMAKRKGITWRREIGRRIADGVDRVFSVAESSIDMTPDFQHRVVRADIPEADPARPPFYTCDPVKPVVLHVIRLGEAAVITSPFELFTDYGIRIQARSEAVLTLVVQLARHHSGYLPTARAVAGGGYSADKFVVGPEGATVFVEESVAAINALWP